MSMKLDLSKLTYGKQLTEAELAVLHYTVEHIDTALKLGVRGIARENFTSTSTVMRLSKKLGFNGFVDMYYKLLPAIRNVEENNQLTEPFVTQFYQSASLKESTLNAETYNSLCSTARLLYKNQQLLYIYGMGFCSMMSEYLAKKLLVLGVKCIYSSASDSIGIFENNLEDVGLVILFSRSGRSEHVLGRAVTAKENEIPLVSFTNHLDNPLTALSTHTICIEDDNPLDDRNMRPTLFFVKMLTLIELLIYEYHRISISTDA